MISDHIYGKYFHLTVYYVENMENRAKLEPNPKPLIIGYIFPALISIVVDCDKSLNNCWNI